MMERHWETCKQRNDMILLVSKDYCVILVEDRLYIERRWKQGDRLGGFGIIQAWTRGGSEKVMSRWDVVGFWIHFQIKAIGLNVKSERKREIRDVTFSILQFTQGDLVIPFLHTVAHKASSLEFYHSTYPVVIISTCFIPPPNYKLLFEGKCCHFFIPLFPIPSKMPDTPWAIKTCLTDSSMSTCGMACAGGRQADLRIRNTAQRDPSSSRAQT